MSTVRALPPDVRSGVSTAATIPPAVVEAAVSALAEVYAGPVLDDLAATVRAGPWRGAGELEGWIADRVSERREGES